jgi:glutamyl-tRNA reductase
MSHRPGLPLVIVDIAVPRNIEPSVGQINNVFLYNIDDLTHIADLSRQQREGEVQKVEEIIKREVAKLVAWQRELAIRPVVSALMKKAEEIGSAQLTLTLRKLRPLSDEERHSLEMMTRSITARILREPIEYLRGNGHADADWAEIVSQLFQLDTKH